MEMEFLTYLNAARRHRQAEKRRRIEQENKHGNRRVILQPYFLNQLDYPRLTSPCRIALQVPKDYRRIPAAGEPHVCEKRAPELGRIGKEEINAELASREGANKHARNPRVRIVTPSLALPLKRSHAFRESKARPRQRETFDANPWPLPASIQSEVSGKPRPAVLRVIRSPAYSSKVNLPAWNHRTTASAICEDYYRRPPQNDQRQGREFFSGRYRCPNVTGESARASPPKVAAPTARRGVRQSYQPRPPRSKSGHSFNAISEEYQGSILSGKNAEEDEKIKNLLYGNNPEDDQIKSILVDKVVDLLVECSPGIQSTGFYIQSVAAYAVNDNIRAGITPTSLMYLLLKIKGTPQARFETFVELATSANQAREQLKAEEELSAEERQKAFVAALENHARKQLNAYNEKKKDACKQRASPSFIKQVPIVSVEPREPISENPTDQGLTAENNINEKPGKSSQFISDIRLQNVSVLEKPKENRQSSEDHEDVLKLEKQHKANGHSNENKNPDEQTPLDETLEVSNEINTSDEQIPFDEMAEVSDEMIINTSDEQIPFDEMAEVSDEMINLDREIPLDGMVEVSDEMIILDEQIPLDEMAEVSDEIKISEEKTTLDEMAEVSIETKISEEQTPLDEMAEINNETKLSEEHTPSDEMAEINNETKISDINDETKISEEHTPSDEMAEINIETKISEEHTLSDEMAEISNETKISEEQTPSDEMAEIFNETKISEERTRSDEMAEIFNATKISEEQTPSDEMGEIFNETTISEERTRSDEMAEIFNATKISEEQTPSDEMAGYSHEKLEWGGKLDESDEEDNDASVGLEDDSSVGTDT